MSVYRFGPPTGRSILALHGLTGHGKRWEHLARHHLSNYYVLAPDLRGHGRAPAVPPWRLETVADDVAMLLRADRPGAPPSIVVGHSFGGAVALHLAARHPELVEALVLLDPAVAVPPPRALMLAEAMLASPDYTDRAEARADKQRFAWGGVAADILDAELDEHLVDTGKGRVGWRMSLPAVTAFWGELTHPVALPPACLRTVVVRAHRSTPPLVTDELCDILRARLDEALTVLDFDCDHMVAEQRPADVAAVIRSL